MTDNTATLDHYRKFLTEKTTSALDSYIGEVNCPAVHKAITEKLVGVVEKLNPYNYDIKLSVEQGEHENQLSLVYENSFTFALMNQLEYIESHDACFNPATGIYYKIKDGKVVYEKDFLE